MRIPAAALAILAFGAIELCTAQSPPKSFHVHYIGGPADFTGEHVDLTVTPQALLMAGKAGKTRKSVSIPLDGIIVVAHSPMRFNRIHQVSPYLPNLSPPSGAQGSGPIANAVDALAFAAWGTYEVTRLMTLGIAGSRHGQKHYVTILWQQGGVEREWVVEAGKDDYGPLMQQLEQFSGKRWVDLDAQYRRFEEAIKNRKNKPVSVALDRPVKVDTEYLPAGPYQLVVLESESGRGELYFFSGKEISDANLRGVAVVEIGSAAAGQAGVDYSSQTPYQITEIRTPEKTFRLQSDLR